MRKFEDQLSRMQSLMTYGMLVNESNDKKGSFEYHKIASDGKAYGIFRECSKYYIKTAPGEKENLAEAYDYIGGWNNRKDYEYDSYANAQKQFDLKMMSINEAYGAKTKATTLDPSKKEELVIEGTEKMRAELARQRQIMFNTGVIIREGSYVGVGDPERVSGNNDADKPYTQKGEAKLDKDMPKASGEPEDQSEPYGDGKAPEKGKDVKSADVLSNGTAVAAERPSGGEVTHVKNINEDCENCAPNGARDWGTEGIGKGNGDPKENGWEMEGQEYVNEEINDAKEWDEGLPGSAGTGEADTDHNNDPFNKPVNEGKDDEVVDNVEGDDAPELGGEDEYDVEGGEDEAPVEDVPASDETPEGEEEIDLGAEDDLGGEDELGGEDDVDLEDDGEEDLESEIAELRAELEALKAQVEGSEDEAPVEDELGGEEPVDDVDVDEGRGWDNIKSAYQGGVESVSNGEGALTPAEKSRFIKNGDIDSTDNSSISASDFADAKAKYNNAVANGSDRADSYAADALQSQPGLFGRMNRRAALGAYNVGRGVGNLKQGASNFVHNTIGLEEAKKAYMQNLVNEVVKGVLSGQKLDEEKTVLHDFGKHPGYRKKPMELPVTGSDNVDGKRDWNDDSVHSEEPFGSHIGDGKPYNNLVQAITNSVLEAIKKKV